MIKNNLFNDISILTEKIKPFTKELDLFLPGGGYRGFLGISIIQYIVVLIKSNKLKIKNIYTTSAGTILGLLFILFLNFDININQIQLLIYNNYNLILNYKRTEKLYNFISLLFNLFPPDLYLYCNNKLFITINQFKKNFRQVKSNFESNEDLKNISIASCSIPLLFSNKAIKINDHYSFDGLFPINTSNQLDCLVINLIDNINIFNCINFPSLTKIDKMFLQGINVADNYFQDYNFTLNLHICNIKRLNHFIKLFISILIILFIFLIIIYFYIFINIMY